MGAGLVIGTFCGLINGFVVTRMKLAPFIATLGMTLIARGTALQLTGAAPVSQLGEAFGVLGNGSFFRTLEKGANGLPHVVFPGIPYPVVLLVLVAIVVAFILSQLPVGRHIYAVGSNEEAARLSGINVERTKMFAYGLSGLMAGLAGIVLMSRLVTAQPNEGICLRTRRHCGIGDRRCFADGRRRHHLGHHDRCLRHRNTPEWSEHERRLVVHSADHNRLRHHRYRLYRLPAEPEIARHADICSVVNGRTSS